MSDKKHKPRPSKPPRGAEAPARDAEGPPAGAEPPSPAPATAAGAAGHEETAAAGKDAAPSGWAAGEAEAARVENAELKDRLLRMAAEMENLRKRTERDKVDTARYAISNFARDVLSIADNIRRAIDHVPAEAAASDPVLKSFLDGVEVTERELHNMLERHGIARLDPRGERFDPNLHQAMFELENPDVAEGTVVEVVQPGYMIAERVLRPALVGVSKGGPKPAKDAPRAANDDQPGGGEPPEGGADTAPGSHVDESA